MVKCLGEKNILSHPTLPRRVITQSSQPPHEQQGANIHHGRIRQVMLRLDGKVREDELIEFSTVLFPLMQACK